MKNMIVESAKKYYSAAVETERQLVMIPSVESSALPGKPFGEEVNRALLFFLKTAEELGFRTKCLDGYAGYAEVGEGDEEVAVVAHLDVVPAGAGWKHEPFGAEIDGDRIYGRGTDDNKLGAVSSLYALKALCDLGVKFKRRVRIIVGCNEETGMLGIKYYKEHEKWFDYGFVPDACFPVISAEKGILHASFELRQEDSPGCGIRLASIECGERVNVVPAVAAARLQTVEFELIKKTAEELGCAVGLPRPISVEKDGDFVTVTTYGVSSHASEPTSGINAAGILVRLLRRLPLVKRKAENGIFTIAHFIGMQYHGERLGINYSDATGKLTLNLGMLSYKDGILSFSIDIRYPMSAPIDTIINPLKAAFEPAGFTMTVAKNTDGYSLPDDHPLVAKLLAAYTDMTGKKGYTMSMGGGTYAREFPGRAVVFGTSPENKPSVAHAPDEYISLEELYSCINIFAYALYKLACEE